MKNIKWWWVGGIGGLVVLLVLLVISWIQTNSLHNDIEDLEAENSSLTNQVSSVQGQLSQAQANLTQKETELTEKETELAAIHEIFPPKEFASSTELQQWLNGNTVSNQPPATSYEGWYGKALQLQQDALNDGFILSADLDIYQYEDGTYEFYVYSVAIIDGFMWYWDPETDEIFNSEFGPLN